MRLLAGLIVVMLLTLCALLGAKVGEGLQYKIKQAADDSRLDAAVEREYQRSRQVLALEREQALQPVRIASQSRMIYSAGWGVAILLPVVIVVCGLYLTIGLSRAAVQKANIWAVTLPANKHILIEGTNYKRLTGNNDS